MVNVKNRVKDVYGYGRVQAHNAVNEAKAKGKALYNKVKHNDKVDIALEYVSQFLKAYIAFMVIGLFISLFSYEIILMASMLLVVASVV